MRKFLFEILTEDLRGLLLTTDGGMGREQRDGAGGELFEGEDLGVEEEDRGGGTASVIFTGSN